MPKRRRGARPLWGTRLFNFLAVVFLGLSVVSLGWIVNTALNPSSRLNPFPPPMRTTAVALMTSTPTPEPHASAPAPSWTATPADTDTPTPQPTITPSISPGSLPSVTSTPSPTRSAFTYTAVITYQVHPVQLCDWMGVAGTVTNLQGQPALGAFVHIWGLGNVDQVMAVGANPIYGPSGWELRLGRGQIVGSWNVQLITSADKAPLSDVYTISMPGDCTKNLAWVRFQRNH